MKRVLAAATAPALAGDSCSDPPAKPKPISVPQPVYTASARAADVKVDASGLLTIAVGFVAAFVAALVVVRVAVGFIGRHGFAPFAWYRIVVGALMLAILLGR